MLSSVVVTLKVLTNLRGMYRLDPRFRELQVFERVTAKRPNPFQSREGKGTPNHYGGSSIRCAMIVRLQQKNIDAT